jgi:hypothetical protein
VFRLGLVPLVLSVQLTSPAKVPVATDTTMTLPASGLRSRVEVTLAF